MSIPVLWLSGPPGVGKTTVGWELFRQLTAARIATGYVDIDQLGMCYPEPATDPGRHRLKARNLGRVLANFQLAGARCVVVSGVVDPISGVPRHEVAAAALTVCRLRIGRNQLRGRLVGRGLRPHQIDAGLREADALDHSDFADIRIDTTGRSTAEVTRLVRQCIGEWPRITAQPATATTVPAANFGAPPILWLCGATGVGKSTIGWRVFEEFRNAGIAAAFIDLEQIGFSRPIPADDPGSHRLKARNLAAVVRTYCAAECVIVVGPVDNDDTLRTYTDALPLTLCRLHAGREQLTRQIMLRGKGLGVQLPGDQLVGQPVPTLHQIADAAAAGADALERAGIGDIRVDIAGRTIDECAREILLQLKPGLVRGRTPRSRG